MRALVTGATGFLGGHLARHLVALGWEIHAVHRSSTAAKPLEALAADGVRLHVFTAAQEVQQIVREVAPDRVFHLATHYLKDHQPDDVGALLSANVDFGTHLLEGVTSTSATVVSAMSYFQFRHSRPSPFSLYSATKQAFFDIGEFYRISRGVDLRQVILYDTYGPGDTREKLIPRLLAVAASGEQVSLGSPDQELNFLYCDDVARGFVAASEPGAPDLMALRAPDPLRVGDIVRVVSDVSGRDLAVSFNPSAPQNDLVRTAGQWPAPPTWKPQVGFVEGIVRSFAG